MMEREDEARELREAIAGKALAVGFDKIGFAPARLPEAGARLEEWLARGYQGEMAWMSRSPERRGDASRSLPSAETVVCCALNYYQGIPVEAGRGQGIVSSYARGKDYHSVLRTKLEEVASFIEERTGEKTRVYVDTGPLLEKAYAVAAGMGWIGKHGNLLSREGSSWFFLGEILVPVPLHAPPQDRSSRNHCGICTRCIDACPTGAIVAPEVVDSRLCISYLTIELRGAIPRELRPLVGKRIYGCDDCQDVCPWNRFARKSEERAFFPREPLASMDLVAMLRMSREDFRNATAGSAVARARYPGFLRNVAVAMGNEGDVRAIPALVEALSHEEALVRGHAAWALGALDDRRALPHLEARLQVEEDAAIREELESAIAAIGGATRSAPPGRPRASS